jgi:hypothetical protein
MCMYSNYLCTRTVLHQLSANTVQNKRQQNYYNSSSKREGILDYTILIHYEIQVRERFSGIR